MPGTLGRLPVSNRRKVGTTSSHHGPYVQGDTRATCSPEELLLRLAFAGLVAISLGLVSRQLRAHRRHLFEANRQLQQRNQILEQTYRHLSVGRLAGGVAHNINNPAAVIVSKAEVMRRRAEREGLSQLY